MEFILLIAVVVIAVLAYRSYRRTQLQTKKRDEISSAELESVKRTADEDITKFGEELQDLDLDMVGKDLGDGARQDYQRALDSYEAAKEAVGKADQTRDRDPGGRPLRDGVRPRPGQRRAPAAAAPVLLLQPAARPVRGGRDVVSSGRRTPRSTGLRR